MPLRKLKASVSSTVSSPAEEQPDEKHAEEQSPPSERRSVWQTSLLLATSAALGGIAVAIWNRRTLAQMRQQNESPNDSPRDE